MSTESRHSRLPSACALALAGLASAWLLTRPEPFALGGDNLTLTYPLLADATQSLRAGRLPAWTTSRWGGSPLAGDPVVGALYPGHVLGFLLTAFPHDRALDIDVAVHLAWLALGTTWWLGSLGVRPVAATAGLAILLTSPTIIVIARSWIQYWAALAWWPWLFGAAARVTTTRSVGPRALAAVALAAQVYSGYPEFALYSGTAALAWVAFGVGDPRHPRPLRSSWSRAGDALAIGLGAVALAAPQVLPGLALARESIRSGPTGEATRALMRGFALTPVEWLAVLSPLPVSDFGAFRIAPALPALALVGALLGDGRARFLAVVTAATVMLATGAAHGALGAFPLFAFFPAPAKFFYLTTFVMTSLAVIGLDRAGDLPPRRLRPLIVIVALSAAPALRIVLAGSWWLPLALGTAAAFAPPRRLGIALLVVVLGAVMANSAAIDPLHSKHLFGPGRFLRLAEHPVPERFTDRPLARWLALENGGRVHQVGQNFAALFGQASWNGIGPLAQTRQLEVMEDIAPGAAAEVALDIGASPLVVVAGGALEDELEAAGFDGPPADGELRVLFAPEVRPRYVLVPEVTFVPRAEAIRAARSGAALGPGSALVEAPSVTDAPAAGDAAGRLELVASRPGFAELSVIVDRPTWLLAREPFFPGWRATVDAVQVLVRPAGGFLLAFEVPAGRHAVRLEYHEPGFARGAAAAVMALVALSVVIARRSRLERHTQRRRHGDGRRCARGFALG